jgi:hypothetical protein
MMASRAVSQENVEVYVLEIKKLAKFRKISLGVQGYNWVDFITSGTSIKDLDKNN